MKRDLVMWAAPLVAAALCYMGSLEAGFAFDDTVAVVDNPLVNGGMPVQDAFSRDFWGDRPGFGHMASWRPLTVLSLRLDHAVGGGIPAPFHRTNLLLHLALVAAVLLLARRWGLRPLVGSAVGLAVAVHPMMSEAVVSVVGRGDLLAALFGILALGAGLERPRLAAGIFALGLLAKESAVVYLGAGCVLALMAGHHRTLGRWAALGIAWYALRSMVVGQGGGEVLPWDNQVVAMEGVERLVGALAVSGRYVAWWLSPQPIAPDYAAAVDLPDVGGLYAWFGGASLVALSVGLVLAWRQKRTTVGVALALAIGSLLLLSNGVLILPTPLAGRLAVPVFLGLTLAAASDFGRAGRRGRWILTGIAAAWLVAGVPSTLDQVDAWQGDGPLFASGVEIEPQSVKSRCNHARQLLRSGDLVEAEEHLREALRLAPDHPLPLTNMAVVLGRLGRAEEAWKMAQAAVQAERHPGRAQGNLCALAVTREQVASGQAVIECERAVGASPELVEPLVNLARAQARAGLGAEAEGTFRRAEERFGPVPFLLGHRVGFRLTRGRQEQALEDQRALVALAPDDFSHRKNLMAVLAQVGAARRESGDTKGACAVAQELRRAAPGVGPVEARARSLCPTSGAIP